MLPESQKFRDLPDWDGLIQSTGGGSRTHTGVSAQRILYCERECLRHFSFPGTQVTIYAGKDVQPERAGTQGGTPWLGLTFG